MSEEWFDITAPSTSTTWNSKSRFLFKRDVEDDEGGVDFGNAWNTSAPRVWSSVTSETTTYSIGTSEEP